MKTYINCYSLLSEDKEVIFRPGINAEVFDKTSQIPTIAFDETPVCRFAIEEKFKEVDSSLEKRWLVFGQNEEDFFYRYFTKHPTEANNYVYLLLTFNFPEEMTKFLLEHAVWIEAKKALIKIPRPNYNLCFLFKSKKLCLTPQELYTY